MFQCLSGIQEGAGYPRHCCSGGKPSGGSAGSGARPNAASAAMGGAAAAGDAANAPGVAAAAGMACMPGTPPLPSQACCAGHGCCAANWAAMLLAPPTAAGWEKGSPAAWWAAWLPPARAAQGRGRGPYNGACQAQSTAFLSAPSR